MYSKCTEVFLSVADMRGFMTSHGQPDQSRSARYVLKDYVNVSHIKWRVGNYCECSFKVKWTSFSCASAKLLLVIIFQFLACLQKCLARWLSHAFYHCDSLQGKLLYCHPPPHINDEDFQPQHKMFLSRKLESSDLSAAVSKKKIKRIENTVDKSFFHQVKMISHFLITRCEMKWIQIRSLSSGECAGAHKGGSDHYGL